MKMVRIFFVISVLAFGLMALGQNTYAAPEAILTVNSAQDTNDGACNALGTGTGNKDCTLREAILAANATVGVKETIQFAIPKLNGTCIISLKKVLPTLTDPVIIDGYSEPGASPNTQSVGDDAQIRIILDGSNADFINGNKRGLEVKGGDTTIKGLAIQIFDYGVELYSDNNTVTGNFIGTGYTGITPAANGTGIRLGGKNNRIGGSFPGERNLISGNTDGIDTYGSDQSTIQGNYIGTDVTGLQALPNDAGFAMLNLTHSTISGNVISGNRNWGIGMFDDSHNNSIKHNKIGVGADGLTAVAGQKDAGIWYTLSDNLQGGTKFPNHDVISGNTIAYNTGAGVMLGNETPGFTDLTKNITISKNFIYSNGKLGIDLGFQDGVTPNDPGDLDQGPNGLQNFPVLTSAMSAIGSTTITGTFNSRIDRTYHLEFFASRLCDASGNGEGATYLGALDVQNNAQGDAVINLVVPKSVPVGTIVTATTTELIRGKLGGTSEFSACIRVGSS